MRLDDNTKRDTLKKRKKKKKKKIKNDEKKQHTNKRRKISVICCAIRTAFASYDCSHLVFAAAADGTAEWDNLVCICTWLQYFSAGLRHDVVLFKHLYWIKIFLASSTEWHRDFAWRANENTERKQRPTEANAKKKNWKENCRKMSRMTKSTALQNFCHLEFHCRFLATHFDDSIQFYGHNYNQF